MTIQSNVWPNFLDVAVVEKDDSGKYYWTPEWRNIMEQLLRQLTVNLGSEGLVSPSQPTTNITLLTQSENGTILYDSTSNDFKGFKAGAWKTFTLT